LGRASKINFEAIVGSFIRDVYDPSEIPRGQTRRTGGCQTRCTVAPRTRLVGVDNVRLAVDHDLNRVLRPATIVPHDRADYPELRIGLARLDVTGVEDLEPIVGRRSRSACRVRPTLTEYGNVGAGAVVADVSRVPGPA
jgi:hypothetical protein